MKRLITLLALAGMGTGYLMFARIGAVPDLVAPTTAIAAPVIQDPDPGFVTDVDAIPGQFVVSFDDGYPDDYGGDFGGPQPPGGGMGNMMMGSQEEQEPWDDGWINPPVEILNPASEAIAADICADYGATLVETFDGIGCFLATMTETQGRAMSHDPRVECVMGDLPGDGQTTQATPQLNEFGLNEWGLDRIDQNAWPANRGTFTYSDTGTGINVYVADSGIWKDHPEFGGRAYWTYSALNGRSPNDQHGHGTAVASVIGGIRTGVAKNVKLRSVRVLDANNRTWVSTVARAMNWIRWNGIKPGVVNCSFGFRKRGSWLFGLVPGTAPVERAVGRVIGRGFSVTVAAMNNNDLASRYSPATVGSANTVGACNENNQRAPFSNYGTDVDIHAPGVNVFMATWETIGGVRQPKYFQDSGTSFAAPYVAGVIAQFLVDFPYWTPSSIHDWLYANATWAQLDPATLPPLTPNRIVYTNR